MTLDGQIRDYVSQITDIPSSELTPDLLREIIISRHINIIHILTGKGVVTFPNDDRIDTTSGKMAAVLNIILIDHFDSVQELYDTIGISEDTIIDLWTTQHYSIRHTAVKQLISTWGVSPTHLYGERSTAFTSPQTSIA